MATLVFKKQSAASVATPPTDYVAQFVDTADGEPKFKTESGAVKPLRGTSLLRPAATLTSSGGVVTVPVTTGSEVYTLTLTENVTSWVFTNLPPSGQVAEIRIDVVQHASSAKTCVSPASAGRTAGGAWTVSSTLSARESLALVIDSAGVAQLYPSGVLA